MTRSPDSLQALLAQYQARVEAALERYLPPVSRSPARLHEAMRYAVLGAGKRIRPVLCYLTGEAVGTPPLRLDGPAAAVEMIHAYSLIHDDLPAMDDDDLRRGRPTTHRAFDEATAILAGDALQVLAFEVLASDPAMTQDPSARLEVIRLLAVASGTQGMAGGQALDLAATGHALELAGIEDMHRRKTGALIAASVDMAAAVAPSVEAGARQALGRYGRALGLAFQIVDDLLDVEGDAELVGKPVRADAAARKPTYPVVAGVAAAHARAEALCQEALDALAPLDGRADMLRQLARFIVERRQ
ncbi:MAG: geranyl transferase [Gammaproteobacteria bacterium SG8_30]|nr:MAG: geranyl transferase [Gammaproteobacteria bacterium SG8_30]